ncbi:MAG: gamma carbonic anhydrase family protein [Desulfobacterales bacterium]
MSGFPATVYNDPAASQRGDVQVGQYSSFWPGSSVRGDFSPIRIGKGSSIQDCCVLHSTPADEIRVGDFVTVGHGAVLHGCIVEDNCVIGMNATVLDKSVIGKGSVVAAGAVVKESSRVPAGSFVSGVPAQIRAGRQGQEERIRAGAMAYIALAQNYIAGRQRLDPETLGEKMDEIRKLLAES